MNIEDLKKNFEKRANEDNAIQMAKYLRNQFVFYGLKSPARRMISIVKCNILFVIICLQWRNMSAMMIYLK